MSRPALDPPGGPFDGCAAVRESIKALLTGAETLRRPGEIGEHLESCPSCRRWEAEAIARHVRGRRLKCAICPGDSTHSGTASRVAPASTSLSCAAVTPPTMRCTTIPFGATRKDSGTPATP